MKKSLIPQTPEPVFKSVLNTLKSWEAFKEDKWHLHIPAAMALATVINLYANFMQTKISTNYLTDFFYSIYYAGTFDRILLQLIFGVIIATVWEVGQYAYITRNKGILEKGVGQYLEFRAKRDIIVTAVTYWIAAIFWVIILSK